MTRLEIEQALQDLNNMVINGQLMEGFEKYYHDEVVMQENSLAPTVSKAANRKREEKFLSDVTEFRKAEIKGVGVGDDLSFVIWKYDYTHREWGKRDYTQISVQQWEDGKIIKETFVYAN